MPVVDIPQLPVTLMTGQARPSWETDPAVPDPVVPAPVTVDAPSLLGAAFRQSNSMVAGATSRTLHTDNSVDPNYKGAWADIVGTKYERHWDLFTDANNAAQTNSIKQDIDAEEADKATLEASPWMAFGANLGAMATDPLMYIPFVGEAAKGVEVGSGAVRAGVQAAVAGGLGVALQEGALQASQQTRPLSESLINIGMGTALTGVLGGTAYGLISAGDRAVEQRALRNLSDVANGRVDGFTGEARGLSAQAVGKPTVEDLTVSGRAAKAVADRTAINPVLRSYQRASSVARDTLLNVYENTLYSVRNERGMSNTAAGAAETEYKQLLNGRMQAAIREESDIFSQMKKSGINMSKREFQDEIGRAMRRGDQGVNDYVSRAATVYRTKVMDTFKDDLIKEGRLPADVAPQDAVSYFSRVWNQKKLIAREGAFKELVLPHFEKTLAEEYKKGFETLQANQARIEQTKADLTLTPEERTKTLDLLRSQGDALDAANPQHVETYNKILETHRTDRAAKDAGTFDYRVKEASDAERARLKAAGGDSYRAFRDAQRELRSRMKSVDFGVAGLEARQHAILSRLTDLEAANEKSLQALIDRGRAFEKITQKFDQKRIDKLIEGYRDKFNDLVRGSDVALQKTQDRIEKLRQTVETRTQKLAEDARDLKARAKVAKTEDPMAKPALDQRAYDAKRKAQELEIEADKRELSLLEASKKSQEAYAERIGRVHERLENASMLDSDAMLAEARAANDELLRTKGSMALSRGERAQRMLTTLDKLDPEKVKARLESLEAKKVELSDKFRERWKRADNVDPLDHTSANFTEFARSIVDEAFDKISGRFRPGEGSAVPEYVVPITKGPMKDKTFHVPDELVEDYLHDNVRAVASRYARASAGEIVLSRRFGGDPTMKSAINEVRAHYDQLRSQIEAAPDLAAALDVVGKKASFLDGLRGKARGMESDAVSKERLLTWLDKDQKGAIQDIEAGRDMIRGTYELASNNGKFGKFVQATNMLNYMRLSGGFVMSSISELYLSAFAHGFAPFIKDYARPLLQNLKGLKAVDEELHLAGLANESVMHGRLMSMAEIGDPFAEGNAFQRLIRNGTEAASRFNGMSLFQDFEERMAGRIGMQRLLKAVQKGEPGEKDAKWLAGLEVSGGMQDRIAKQFAEHGHTEDGIHVPNTEDWTDDLARDVFRNAMQKHVTTIVVKPGFGDLPLAARTPLGKMMLQFRTFSLAAHQRTTLRAMQEGPAQLLSGLVGTTTLGMIAAYLSAARSGKENFDKWLAKAEANPVWWIMEGVDRGGMIPLLMEASNNVEKATSTMGTGAFNPIKTPIASAFGDTGGQSSRVVSRDLFTTLLGPTAGLLTNATRAGGAGVSLTKGEDVKAAQQRALVNLMPFGSFMPVKEALQFVMGDSPLQ